MNRDDVISRETVLRMAREAGDLTVDQRGRMDFSFDEYGLERFAQRVVAHALVEPCCGNYDQCQKVCMPRAAFIEREACAQICEDSNDMCSSYGLAQAIRSRGNT